MSDYTSEIPYGYCQCGCGLKTKIPTKNDRRANQIKGVPVLFIQGHHARMQKRESVEQRFWAKVDIAANTDECWKWQGYKNPGGYGNFFSNGESKYGSTLAHRFSYELAYGEIPNGLLVCHKCDTRDCVNPSHLFLGTYADNNRDMLNKGRANKSCGEEVFAHKLTSEDVLKIRETFAQGGITKAELGRRFGVKADAVRSIVTRKTWKHI